MCRSELTFRCTSHLRPAEQSVLVSQDAPWTSHPLAAPRGKARTCACDDKHGVPASRKLGSRGWLFAVRFNMAMHQVGCKRAFLKAPVFAKSPPRLLQYEQFARLPSVYHCCVADTAGSTEFHKHKWTCPVFPPGKIVHSAFQATGSSVLPGQPRLTNIGLSRAIRYHIFSEEPADPYWKQVRYTPVTPAKRNLLPHRHGEQRFSEFRFFQMWGVLDGTGLRSRGSKAAVQKLRHGMARNLHRGQPPTPNMFVFLWFLRTAIQKGPLF